MPLLAVLLLVFIGCGKHNDLHNNLPESRSWQVRSITQYVVNGNVLDMVRISHQRETDARANVIRQTATTDGKAMRVRGATLEREVFEELYELMNRYSMSFATNTVVMQRKSYYGYRVDGTGRMNYFEFDKHDLHAMPVSHPGFLEEVLRGVEGWVEWEESDLDIEWKFLAEIRHMRSTSAETWPKDTTVYETLIHW